MPDSPLAPITYLDPITTDANTPKIPDYTQSVIDAMIYLPWFETYGLSYEQTMRLPYEEWRRMHKALQEKVQQANAEQSALTDVNKQISQMIFEMLKKQTKPTV